MLCSLSQERFVKPHSEGTSQVAKLIPMGFLMQADGKIRTRAGFCISLLESWEGSVGEGKWLGGVWQRNNWPGLCRPVVLLPGIA